jgi:hypothetical protein
MGSNTLLIAPIIAHQRRLGVLPLADPLRRIREFDPISRCRSQRRFALRQVHVSQLLAFSRFGAILLRGPQIVSPVHQSRTVLRAQVFRYRMRTIRAVAHVHGTTISFVTLSWRCRGHRGDTGDAQ